MPSKTTKTADTPRKPSKSTETPEDSSLLSEVYDTVFQLSRQSSKILDELVSLKEDQQHLTGRLNKIESYFEATQLTCKASSHRLVQHLQSDRHVLQSLQVRVEAFSDLLETVFLQDGPNDLDQQVLSKIERTASKAVDDTYEDASSVPMPSFGSFAENSSEDDLTDVQQLFAQDLSFVETEREFAFEPTLETDHEDEQSLFEFLRQLLVENDVSAFIGALQELDLQSEDVFRLEKIREARLTIPMRLLRHAVVLLERILQLSVDMELRPLLRNNNNILSTILLASKFDCSIVRYAEFLRLQKQLFEKLKIPDHSSVEVQDILTALTCAQDGTEFRRK